MNEQPRPLLPTLSDPQFDRAMRQMLHQLRDLLPDERARSGLTAVLEGRAELRDLASSEDFANALEPHMSEGMRLWDAMSPDEKLSYQQRAAEEFGHLDRPEPEAER